MANPGHARGSLQALEILSRWLCSAPWPQSGGHCVPMWLHEQAGIAGLWDPSLEAQKLPCCAPDPSNTAWPILAVSDGGKSVTGSGLVTLFPKPYPSLRPPAPIRSRTVAGRKSPRLPWPRQIAPRSPCSALCVYFTSSHRQIQARAGSTFYFP